MHSPRPRTDMVAPIVDEAARRGQGGGAEAAWRRGVGSAARDGLGEEDGGVGRVRAKFVWDEEGDTVEEWHGW